MQPMIIQTDKLSAPCVNSVIGLGCDQDILFSWLRDVSISQWLSEHPARVTAKLHDLSAFCEAAH